MNEPTVNEPTTMKERPDPTHEAPPLVLASASPRRREILERMGFEFTSRPADLDETPQAGELPGEYVLRLAREKARAVARPGELVLAADTTVVLDGEILGKPENDDEAREMLTRLSGREHEVATGVALCDLDRALQLAQLETTRVRFAPLTEEEIEWYVGCGEGADKAGAYGIQGRGALFIESVEGDYSAIVGLPIATVYRLLRRAGYRFAHLPRLSRRI